MIEPLTPPDCDLRGMPYMPLDITRLFDSDFYVHSTGDEFKAAVTLWGKAFLQVPAGSLPDDDRVLAHLSNAGAKWKKVRTMALRGFVKCLDGRLYHPTVCEKALDAWKARLSQRDRTEKARAARAAQRQEAKNDDDTTVTKPVTASVTENATDTVTESKGREGKGREVKKEPPSPPEPSPAASALDANLRLVCADLGLPAAPRDWPPHWTGLRAKLEAWLAAGADLRRHILPACADFMATPGRETKAAAYLGGIVQRRQRDDRGPAPTAGPDPRAPETDAKAMARMRSWRAGEWHEAGWGPQPGKPGCLIPAHILEQFKEAA